MGKSISKLILLFLFLFPTNALSEFRHYNDWTTREKLEFASYALVNYTDYAQTEYCFREIPTCKEINPILGKNPSDGLLVGAFLASQLSYYYLIGSSSEHRKWIFAFKIAIVVSNDINGVSISKVW